MNKLKNRPTIDLLTYWILMLAILAVRHEYN